MKKKILSLLTLILIVSLSVFTLTACGGGGNDGDSANGGGGNGGNGGGHTHSYVQSEVQATCATAGYTLFKCSCGHSYTENETPKKFHVLNENGNCTACQETPSVGLKIVNGAVRGVGDYTGKDVIIPSSVDGVTTTSINSSAFKSKDVETVYIPATVKSIGKQAFSGCASLKKVIFYGESQLETIGEQAFYGCSNLKGELVSGVEYISSATQNLILYKSAKTASSVTIDDDCVAVYDDAFYGDETITELTIPNTVKYFGKQAFYQSYNLANVNYLGSLEDWLKVTFGNGYSNPGYNSGNVTYNGQALSVVTITTSVVPEYAFINNRSISQIILSDSVTTVGSQAFAGCEKCFTMSIGKNVTSIGNKAFLNCYRLVEIKNDSNVEIEAGVVSPINGNAGEFVKNVYSSTSGKSLLVEENGYKSISFGGKNYVLEYTGTDKNVVIPAKFDELLPYAFYNNKTMETLDLGTNLKVIGNFSFFGCTSLKAIYIPSNIEEIGISAFQGCYSVETLTFQGSSKLKTIGKYGFAGLALVESIVLPHGLELADSYCFMGCSNLTEFIMPGTLKRLSYKMIHGCDKLEIAYFNGIGFGEMAMEKDPETGHLYFFYWYYKSGLKWVITEAGAWEVEPNGRHGI